MINLPDTICTPQDLTELLVEVREYAKWYEHESVKRRSGTKTPTSTQPVLSVSTATYLRAVSTNGTLQPVQLETIIHSLRPTKRLLRPLLSPLQPPPQSASERF